VAGFVEPAGLEFAAGVADLRRLREGADRRRRVSRQLQQRRLFGRALGIAMLAAAQRGIQLRHRSLHRRVVHARRVAARLDRGVVRRQRDLSRMAALAQRSGRHLQLVQSLLCEREPGLHAGIQLLLLR
jgi:hypothetical protein